MSNKVKKRDLIRTTIGTDNEYYLEVHTSTELDMDQQMELTKKLEECIGKYLKSKGIEEVDVHTGI